MRTFREFHRGVGGICEVLRGLALRFYFNPFVRFNGVDSRVSDMYRDITPIVFPRLTAERGDGVDTLADGFAQLAVDLDIPTCLEEVKIAEGDIENLATEAMKVTRLLQNNPREVKWEDARDLYTQALRN